MRLLLAFVLIAGCSAPPGVDPESSVLTSTPSQPYRVPTYEGNLLREFDAETGVVCYWYGRPFSEATPLSCVVIEPCTCELSTRILEAAP